LRTKIQLHNCKGSHCRVIHTVSDCSSAESKIGLVWRWRYREGPSRREKSHRRRWECQWERSGVLGGLS